jgi:NADH-quinone oxidoreductase subunit G
VLPGGRLTAEDAYAYAKFARAVLGTNDIDFRARAHSAEEEAFLASSVVATALDVTYADLESARSVVLAGFDPEDESPIVFLRLRKAVRRHGLRVFSVASHTTRGLDKLSGTLVRAVPGTEAQALAALAEDGSLALDHGSVILVGERLAGVPGALSAVVALAERTGARLAWVPRRAGERGALEAGCLPNLLPGGRPVADAGARADLGAAWGIDNLPRDPGRDTAAILGAAADGRLQALVVGGVELDDLPDPQAALAAIDAVPFLVSLEIRASSVSERADVVFPVAAAAEKAGTFVNWEGRLRPFDIVLDHSNQLPDLRVLAGVAEQLRPAGLGFRTVAQVRAEMGEVGAWDGEPVAMALVAAAASTPPGPGQVVLSTWRQLIDDSRMAEGEPYLAATARRSVARMPPSLFVELGLAEGDEVVLRTRRGAVTLPAVVADLPERVVWAPTNSGGLPLARVLGVGAGDVVGIEPGARGVVREVSA